MADPHRSCRPGSRVNRRLAIWAGLHAWTIRPACQSPMSTPLPLNPWSRNRSATRRRDVACQPILHVLSAVWGSSAVWQASGASRRGSGGQACAQTEAGLRPTWRIASLRADSRKSCSTTCQVTSWRRSPALTKSTANRGCGTKRALRRSAICAQPTLPRSLVGRGLRRRKTFGAGSPQHDRPRRHWVVAPGGSSSAKGSASSRQRRRCCWLAKFC